jgi:hypothetical protein
MSSDFKHQPGAVAGFVRGLRGAGGVPVNFIRADEEVEIGARPGGVGVDEALDWLVAQTARYRWDEIGGRYVLYPADDVWQSVVSGIEIKDVPRLDAASLYTDAARAQVAALADLAGPVMKGDPRSHVFTDPVSLRPSATVLEHFVELLGDDERLAFTVERSLSGVRVMHFEWLPPAPGGEHTGGLAP